MFRNILKIQLVTVLLLFIAIGVSAQERTYSPLSRYGYGEKQNIGYNSYAGMGYTGIALQSSYGLNNVNPAANAALDSMSFYFEGGLNYYYQGFNSSGNTASNSNLVFDYLALGFSISPKVNLTAGFVPYTSTGYDYQDVTTEIDYTVSTTQVTGEGNVTELYVGLGFQPLKNLYLGVNGAYLFGNIHNISRASFSDTYSRNYGFMNELNVSTYKYDLGMQYKFNLGKDKKGNDKSLIIGATYQPKIQVRGEYETLKASGGDFANDYDLFESLTSSGTAASIDTIEYSSGNIQGGQYDLAQEIGVGVSYNVRDKLRLGFDYTTENWSEASFKGEKGYFSNSTEYSFGAEFIPMERAARNYLNRVRYRIGAYYKDDYMTLDNNDINNYGVTLGFGLPMRRSKTQINVAFEYGKRATKGSDLYKENYGKVTLNFSLHETWFRKRKLE